MRPYAMRGALRPRTLLFKMAVQAVYLCPLAVGLRWGLSYLLAGFVVPGASQPRSYGLILLSPLGAGLALASHLREPFKHPMAAVLPGIRRRFLLWHGALAAGAAVVFAALESKLVPSPAPIVPTFALALAALTAGASPISGQVRRPLDRGFIALCVAMAIVGGFFFVELAAGMRRFPLPFTVLGLASAAFSLATAYERERGREDAAARNPRLPLAAFTPSAHPQATLPVRIRWNWKWTVLAPLLGGAAYGTFLRYRSWALFQGRERHTDVVAGMTITFFLMMWLEPNPGRILIRNDRSPVTRPRRLRQATQRFRRRLGIAALATALACWGFTIGIGRSTPLPDFWLIGLTLELAAVTYSLALTLQFASERWLKGGWVRGARFFIVLAAAVPCGVPLFLHSLPRYPDAYVSWPIAGLALAIGGLLYLASVAILKSHYLRGDLLTREG